MSTDKQNRKNDDIRVAQLRVIDAEGENRGILSTEEAMQIAKAAGLDLVEIDPNGTPPVARIMDFGRFRFEQQKRTNLAKKKSRATDIKELKFRPTTDDGDFQVKIKNARRFLADGDKIKITIRFRGRELAHPELGMAMSQKVETELGDEITVEQRPKLEGRQMVMMISPKRR